MSVIRIGARVIVWVAIKTVVLDVWFSSSAVNVYTYILYKF